MKLTKMPIMKVGSHTAMDGRVIAFTAAMLQEIADNYDAALSESPLVIGHPTITAPAYGWVKQASFEGDTLYAHVGQVEAAFAEAVNEGRYKKRSASIFLPDSPGNPKPGHYYLNHVGFLGAVPPAVKGLADVKFAANDGSAHAVLDFAFDVDSTINPNKENAMDKDKEKEAAEKAAAEAATKREAEIAAREAALATREAEVKKAEAERAKAEKEAETKQAVEFCDQLIKDGKLLPAKKNGLVEVLVTLGRQPVSFSDGSQTVQQSAVDILKEVLNQKPLDFAEKSADTGTQATDGAVNFADGASIAQAASQYHAEQAQKGIHISMTDAVNHIMKGAKQGLIVGYSTEGEVKGCHVVCHGEEVGSVKQATAATDKLLGVSTRVTTNATEHTDVVRSGLAPVTYGDTVKRGDPLTADALGRAVKATSGNIILGIAEEDGEVDEVGSVFLMPGISAA